MLDSTHLRVAAALLALLVVQPAAAKEGDSLRLRVNSVQAEAGATVAVVVRTYASRPVGQGQLCVRATRPTKSSHGPFASLDGAEVFSTAGDATTVATIDQEDVGVQLLVLNFATPSASVNEIDGPLAVFFLTLDPLAAPLEVIDLELDVANSFLIDSEGILLGIEPRGGKLTVKAPGDPSRVEIEAGKVVAGKPADLGVATMESFSISGGQVGVRYDAALLSGPPTVVMDSRHGGSVFEVDTPMPGLLVVSFHSPLGDLNEVPGKLIQFQLATSAAAPPDTVTEISFEPDLTFFADEAGGLHALDLKADQLTFEEPKAKKPKLKLKLRR